MIGETISHYRIIKKLGEGGMGVVYLGEDVLLQRRVAIKTLNSKRGSGDQHFRARFLREARAISALSHQNIANIYDYGETADGQPYIVMELVEGKTLVDLMRDQSLTIPRSIEIVKQVAEALSEAHHRGIVHRDIKPSNIAINERGIVKVLDFGLAKHVIVSSSVGAQTAGFDAVHTQTREGIVIGTPMYLSPEQALGVEVDARSDLFSLGSVLYECIAGRPAFAGASDIDICAKVIRDDPPAPSQFNANIPPALEQITLKALAKKPDARYQTAADLISDLQTTNAEIQKHGSERTITRLLSRESSTQPSSALATLSDILKRPRLSIGYVIAALIIITMLGLGVWLWKRPRLHVPPLEAQKLYETGTEAIRNGSFFQASKALELAIHIDDRFALAHARLAEAFTELDYQDKAKDEMLRVGELTPDRSILTPVDSLYLDAVTATVRRDFSAAIQAYQEITRRQPEKPLVYVDLGRAYEKGNQTDKAIESYTEAVKRDPQTPIALLRLGILNGRQHRFPEANAAFDRAEMIYQTLGNVEGRAEVTLQRGVFLNEIVGKVDDSLAQLESALEMAKVVNNPYQQIKILFQLTNVSFKLGKTDQAQRYATDAVNLAQSNGMETLIARGFIDLGYTYFVRADYVNAERNFQRGLEFAQRFAARQNEARAELSLASLYMQRGDAEKALTYEGQAVAFYKTGGYRTEISQAINLRGRAYRQKGDYTSALQALQEQLKLAEDTGDRAQIAAAHTSIGYLLLDQEKYQDALQHFEKNYEINQSLNNQLNKGYALMNRGATHWRMGQYAEAQTDLDSATEIAKRDDSNFRELQAYILLIEAQMAFSDRHFPQAIAQSEQAIVLAGDQNKIAAARGKSLIGLSLSLSGETRKGKDRCQEAVDLAQTVGDPLLRARAQLALAEAALLSGDTKGALSLAQQAQTFFATAGLAESEWRARLIEGLANQKSGDRATARTSFAYASELISSLKSKWTDEIYSNYLNRADIKVYRDQLTRAQRPQR